jgi:hypothetical protein
MWGLSAVLLLLIPVTPDYVLCAEKIVDKFIAECKKTRVSRLSFGDGC